MFKLILEKTLEKSGPVSGSLQQFNGILIEINKESLAYEIRAGCSGGLRQPSRDDWKQTPVGTLADVIRGLAGCSGGLRPPSRDDWKFALWPTFQPNGSKPL